MSIFSPAGLNISAKIRQLLPAQPCVLCGAMSHHALWCEACDAALPYHDMPHCPLCALPTPQGETCGHCLKKPPAFDRAVAAFSYRFPLDKLIQAMKYGEQLNLSSIFAEKLLQRMDTAHLPDCILPMPLHPAKLGRRGFNQSQLLAARLAKDLGIPLLTHACQRLRDTPSQSSLPWKARTSNVRGAFQCDTDLSGLHIALVDDVLTTGASLNALSLAARKRGAAEISVWVVARTLPHGR
ncbi:MAG: ComF family protein [Gallionella sp.]|nr:ComF family protein [Gallionella sp.]MDD4946278.1 ComF family protein [Gallionella sp.]MDD5612896.1 ComF family protein [Gallionella sp.]